MARGEKCVQRVTVSKLVYVRRDREPYTGWGLLEELLKELTTAKEDMLARQVMRADRQEGGHCCHDDKTLDIKNLACSGRR